MNIQRIASSEVQQFEIDHFEAARKLAPECMVLLENAGALPVKTIGKIALFGSGARKTIKGGTGSGNVNVRDYVTVEEGLKKAGFEITTTDWLDAYDALNEKLKKEFYADLRAKADAMGANPIMFAMGQALPEPEYEIPLLGEGDTAIYVLARISGEGSDRTSTKGDINLTDTEVRDILFLNRTYKEFILVLNVGGMVDLEPVKEVKNILLMGQLGSATGDALADVLTGKSYPSGKLTMTWAPINDYASTEGFGDPNDTYYREGIYVGYRYFDTIGYTPTYPFGYGLTYTSFEMTPKEIKANEEEVAVTVTVKNTGNYPGKEVVQVYYSAPNGALDKPYQELAGYGKTKELAPMESEEITVTYPTNWMASYSEAASSYIMEAGQYIVRVGNCSNTAKAAAILTLDQDVVIEKDRTICGGYELEEYKPVKKVADTIQEGLPKLSLCADNFEQHSIIYQEEPKELPAGEVCTWEQVKSGEKTLDEFVGGLTEDQLMYLCIGAYKDTEDYMEVIGNASSNVAGAAGETTQKLKELGVPVLVMADGPAGVRLSRQYKFINGEVKSYSNNFGEDFTAVYTEEELQEMALHAPKPSKEEQEAPIYYQYCVAIPIGTGIAQSWNQELAKTCGDLIGEEMELFGTHLWLAPAMNIYRSPLCGRNFEYFSEDPVISGLTAAAITQGVQKHEGCATTIKHFACNNQETNRYFSNSILSERALREIYLKGFEICVKKAQPHFIMTSYNLINGEHACNSKDIQTYTLRDEWGFKGVVMTDWLVTGGMESYGEKWSYASAAGNIKAGNDITMPGLPSDKRDMEEARKNPSHPYALTKAELQLSAKRVLEMILKLA